MPEAFLREATSINERSTELLHVAKYTGY